MGKLTKSLPIIKERNCNASLVLDTRTNCKNASEFPLSIRLTVDRKIFYHSVGDFKTFKKFSESLAWETEVWIADMPEHMIHLNGDRFMGPR